MGEAKRRGTFDMRKTQSIARNEQKSIERAQAAAERFKSAQNRAGRVIVAGQPRRRRSLITLAVSAGLLK